MRIRSIKPEFYVSESVGRLSRDARLLFIGLWSFADDSGRGRGALPAISGALFPYDDDAMEKLPAWFCELEREGMVRRYKCADGNTYYDIPNWLKHQKIEKPSRSKFPEFTEPSPNIPRLLPEGSPLDQGAGSREQGPMEQGKEYVVVSTKVEPCGAAAPPSSPELPLAPTSPFKAIAAADPLPSPAPTTKKLVVDRYEAAKAILEFLNTEAGRSFTPVPAHLNLIRDRIREALDDLEGIRTMIRRQVRMWSKTKMEEFLRPSTLFNRTKFSGYYDDRNQPLPPQDGSSGRQPAQKMHPDGRPKSIPMQILREVEAEMGLVPGQY